MIYNFSNVNLKTNDKLSSKHFICISSLANSLVTDLWLELTVSGFLPALFYDVRLLGGGKS